MEKLRNPRLRRLNVVVNSFDSSITDATKEFSRTPEMSFSKMVSKPRMFFEKFKGTITFKQLEGNTNTHSWRHFNKQVDMINTDVKFINFEPFSISNLPQEEFTIHSEPIKLEGIFSILDFPDKMESILPKAMFSRFQIHFSSPEHSSNYIHQFNSEGLVSRPSDTNQLKLLNFEDGDSSPNLKVGVSSPWM